MQLLKGGESLKKLLFCIFSVILIAANCASCLNNKNVLTNSLSNLPIRTDSQYDHINKYDSPYTIGYKNKTNNQYSIYIFSSPIQFSENGTYKLIDNSIVKSQRKEYAFENKENLIKTYFPKKLEDGFRVERGEEYLEFKPVDSQGFSAGKKIIYKNMYGNNVSAVVYNRKDMDMVFYSTKAGIKSELVLKQKSNTSNIKFVVKSSGDSFEDHQNGYILFKKEGANSGLIYQPLILNAGKINVLENNIKIEEKDDYSVLIPVEKLFDGITSENKVKIDPSFELYSSKMPDTGIHSEYNINSYLSPYAVIGDHPFYGEGQEYIRMRFNYFFGIKPESILSSKLHIKAFETSKKESSIDVYENLRQWSSTQMFWGNRHKDSKLIGQGEYKENECIFNLTDYTKKCFADDSWMTESYGLSLRKNEGYSILSSSDNSIYSSYIVIKTSEEPFYFQDKQNINQDVD